MRKGRLRIFGFSREVIERIECGTLGKIGRILLRGFSETVCVDVGFKDIFNRDYFNCGCRVRVNWWAGREDIVKLLSILRGRLKMRKD